MPIEVHARHPGRHPLWRARQGRIRNVRNLWPLRPQDLPQRPRRAPQPRKVMERHRRLQGRGREAWQAVHGELQEVRGPSYQGRH